MKESGTKAWEAVKSFFGAMSKTTRIILAVILTVILLAVTAVWVVKENQPYGVVFYDLTSSDIASISQWMNDNGLGDFKVEDNNLMVPSPLVDSTKAALYIAGYPTSGSGYQTYYEHLGTMSTDADKEQAFIFDLQNRLAGVIRHYAGVKDATVTIAEGEDRRYILDSANLTPTSASVFLYLSGSQGISDEVAAAIRLTVSHSVADLDIEYVGIVDSLGNSYTQSLNGSDQIENASYMKLKLENDHSNTIRTDIMWILTPIYGSNNVRVSVKSTIDVNPKLVSSTEYPEMSWGVADDSEDGRGLIGSEVWNNYTYGPDGTMVGGIVGATPNSDFPFYPVDTDGDGVLDTFGGSQGEVIYKNDEVQQQIQYLAGTLTDLQVSVSINSDVVTADDNAVEDLIRHIGMAAGINTDIHGNKVSVLMAPFVELPVEVEESGLETWMWFAIIAGIALFIIILIIIIILIRKKKREEEERIAQEEEERLEEERLALEAEALAAVAEVPGPADGADIMDMNTEKSMELRKDLRTFVGNNPEIAASLLRNLMKGGETVDAS